MEVEEVKRLIAGGEKIDVELKKSTRELNIFMIRYVHSQTGTVETSFWALMMIGR